ncbi:MAG: fatty acid desaturase [Gammaproteobacteria bacterium]|nr:fatty acid desaturase [Gammaproteobacteria bacterium]
MTFIDWLNNGFLDLSVVGLVAYTLVVTHITIVSVTVYLHRHSAHRAVDLHPALQHFFRFWLWLTTGMSTRVWTSIHRKHHAVCETEDDPHSPVVQGLNKILWEGAERYRESAAQPEIMEKYGAGCPDDWMERNFYSAYTVFGVTSLAFINIALFGVIGLTVWAVQMIWIPFFAAGVINGIGHYWGYRNFECPDAATNIVPWGILIGGEEMHNNHHTYPNSAKFSQKPWEFDIGWFWIRFFQILRLAKPLSTGPVVEQIPGKTTIDIDTAWAVLNDRFRVMAKYAEKVIGPLVEHELHKAGSVAHKLVRRAKIVLCKEESLVDDAGKHRISELVEAHPDIKLIYELRLGLQAVWSKRGGNADELLNALKQWCLDAEATGLQVLRDFVEELKSYSIPKLVRA